MNKENTEDVFSNPTDHLVNQHWLEDTNLLNLNGNLLVALEILTTGITPKYDDIFEICVLPLNSFFDAHKGILPFYCLLKPKRPENIDPQSLLKVRKWGFREKVLKACTDGIDAYQAADMFDRWFDKINFAHNKKLSIICYNWIDKKPFIVDWLGQKYFDMYFDYRYRDPLPVGIFFNDHVDFRKGETFLPFPKLDFQYMTLCTKTDHDNRTRDTMITCYALADMYKKMINNNIACY